MLDFLTIYLPEFFYVLCAFVSFDTAYRATRNKEAKVGTTLFWALLGVIFMLGKLLPNVLIGAMLVVMGCLTATNQVKMGEFTESTHEFRQQASEKLGNKIFIPAVSIGVMALILSLIQYNAETAQTFFLKLSNFFTLQLFSFGSSAGNPTALDGAVMTGIACLVALVLAMIICKPKLSETRSDTSRLLMQVGASCLLPQLLEAY